MAYFISKGLIKPIQVNRAVGKKQTASTISSAPANLSKKREAFISPL